MESRMDKYSNTKTSVNSGSSRSSRNKKLYEDLYNTGTYSNSVVIDDKKEFDISKIKEIIEKEKNVEQKKERPKLDLSKVIIDEDEEITEKIYDINEVLKNAKSKRDIIAEANEKRKNTKNDYIANNDIEEELAKTRKIYDKILQEETELLDIMNTLTLAQASESSTKTSYKNISSEATNTVKQVESVKLVKEEQPEEKETTKEYSTNTFMFDKRDFAEEELSETIKSTNAFIKVLIFFLIVGVIIGAYYVITTFILK